MLAPFTWINASEAPGFIDMIRTSQNLMAEGKSEAAEAPLLEWEKNHSEVRASLTFCYQRFFVALEGKGDRATAREVLLHLTKLAEEGSINTESPELLSVVEAWYRTIFLTDSDMILRARKRMMENGAQNTK